MAMLSTLDLKLCTETDLHTGILVKHRESWCLLTDRPAQTGAVVVVPLHQTQAFRMRPMSVSVPTVAVPRSGLLLADAQLKAERVDSIEDALGRLFVSEKGLSIVCRDDDTYKHYGVTLDGQAQELRLTETDTFFTVERFVVRLAEGREFTLRE